MSDTERRAYEAFREYMNRKKPKSLYALSWYAMPVLTRIKHRIWWWWKYERRGYR